MISNKNYYIQKRNFQTKETTQAVLIKVKTYFKKISIKSRKYKTIMELVIDPLEIGNLINYYFIATAMSLRGVNRAHDDCKM